MKGRVNVISFQNKDTNAVTYDRQLHVVDLLESTRGSSSMMTKGRDSLSEVNLDCIN